MPAGDKGQGAAIVWQKRNDFISDEIDGEALLYCTTQHEVIHLNETATVIWKLCDGTRTSADITDVLSVHYPEARAEIAADVSEAISFLLKRGTIEPLPPLP
ncbi:PqqD family protein [Bradyrhizobium betae]|jgi:Coenzyme PQQ synthesis protein D (PqqD)|uniref:PqqD family protein n=1 Tax=Bradyrhizobium betae TaxID=244734 RepID=UPI003D665993